MCSFQVPCICRMDWNKKLWYFIHIAPSPAVWCSGLCKCKSSSVVADVTNHILPPTGLYPYSMYAIAYHFSYQCINSLLLRTVLRFSIMLIQVLSRNRIGIYLLNPSWIDFHKNKFELKVIKVLQRLLLIHQYLKLNFDSIKAQMWFASKVFHQIHLLKKKLTLLEKTFSAPS